MPMDRHAPARGIAKPPISWTRPTTLVFLPAVPHTQPVPAMAPLTRARSLTAPHGPRSAPRHPHTTTVPPTQPASRAADTQGIMTPLPAGQACCMETLKARFWQRRYLTAKNTLLRFNEQSNETVRMIRREKQDFMRLLAHCRREAAHYRSLLLQEGYDEEFIALTPTQDPPPPGAPHTTNQAQENNSPESPPPPERVTDPLNGLME